MHDGASRPGASPRPSRPCIQRSCARRLQMWWWRSLDPNPAQPSLFFVLEVINPSDVTGPNEKQQADNLEEAAPGHYFQNLNEW